MSYPSSDFRLVCSERGARDRFVSLRGSVRGLSFSLPFSLSCPRSVSGSTGSVLLSIGGLAVEFGCGSTSLTVGVVLGMVGLATGVSGIGNAMFSAGLGMRMGGGETMNAALFWALSHFLARRSATPAARSTENREELLYGVLDSRSLKSSTYRMIRWVGRMARSLTEGFRGGLEDEALSERAGML